MPFRKGYEGVYDQATLALLQDVFEYVWLANTLAPLVSREEVARQVLAAHEAGLAPDSIKERVLAELLRPAVSGPSPSGGPESPDSQK